MKPLQIDNPLAVYCLLPTCCSLLHKRIQNMYLHPQLQTDFLKLLQIDPPLAVCCCLLTSCFAAGEESAAQADTEHVPAPPVPDRRHQAPAH